MSEVQTGRTGEIIALLRLTQLGLEAQIVNIGTSDILVVANSKTWRVQVKASKMKNNGGNSRSPGYQFCISKGLNPKRSLSYEDCDIVALVAIDIERVMFTPVEFFTNIKTKRLKPTDYEQDDLEETTWKACVDWYVNNR
jgi:hypothetical protein